MMPLGVSDWSTVRLIKFVKNQNDIKHVQRGILSV